MEFKYIAVVDHAIHNDPWFLLPMSRIDYTRIAPDGMKAVRAVHGYVRESGLGPVLVELVYLRVSQINGCAYCLDLHARELGRLGVEPEKLALVQAWREAGSLFDVRERAALAWSETVCRVAKTGIPDEEFQAVSAIFGQKEVVDLTIAVGVIDTFNRIAIAFRQPPKAAISSHSNDK